MQKIDYRELIVERLQQEKAYAIQDILEIFGVDITSNLDPFNSKKMYISSILSSIPENKIADIAEEFFSEYYSYEFEEATTKNKEISIRNISELTRRDIINQIILTDNISGNIDIISFLKRIWRLDEMPSTDARFKTAAADIYQHMINNDDWDINYLLYEYLGLLSASYSRFIKFVEELAHPVVRGGDKQKQYVDSTNILLRGDGYELRIVKEISGRPVYQALSITQGIQGNIKNLIFAADGPKPEIVISDALHNDIQIVKNENHCLIYTKHIGKSGLLWKDLVQWWSDTGYKYSQDLSVERSLYRRLLASLDSPPEKQMFLMYFTLYRKNLGDNLPALIPQVYMHYDPLTTLQLKGNKRLSRQRMDFLILFPDASRVVIEIDGKHHYADGDKANPNKYSEMVSADRQLRLAGYELYRFGGYELMPDTSKYIIHSFFDNLLKKHSILPS